MTIFGNFANGHRPVPEWGRKPRGHHSALQKRSPQITDHDCGMKLFRYRIILYYWQCKCLTMLKSVINWKVAFCILPSCNEYPMNGSLIQKDPPKNISLGHLYFSFYFWKIFPDDFESRSSISWMLTSSDSGFKIQWHPVWVLFTSYLPSNLSILCF